MEKSQTKFNIEFKLLPFGHASIEIKKYQKEKQEEKILPVYTEPKTSNIEVIEINFEKADYIVPKTTGGCL